MQQPLTARRFALLAKHYEVTAALAPAEHRLTARAKIDFRADASTRTVEVELHPALKINSVYGADRRALPFEREGDTPLVRVTLPQAVNAGESTTLTFEYAGPLAEADDMLAGGVRWAYIGNEGSYLLQPARWFPLTDYPANRYTAVFQIAAPANLPVIGPGDYVAPVTVGGDAAAAPAQAEATAQAPPSADDSAVRPPSKRAPAKAPAAPPPAAPAQAPTITPGPIVPAGADLYTFRNHRPEVSGTFVAAALQLTPVNAQGMAVPVYTAPAQAGSARQYGEAVAKIFEVFSAEFTPLPNLKLALAQLPPIPGAPQGFSAPGLLLVNPRQWNTADVNTRLLSQLVARQWWGNEIRPATLNDAWLSDGLSRYSEVIYARTESDGDANQALEDFAVNALMYEEAAPIAQAARLAPYSAEYRSVVMNKGAMVFHMLRGQLGEERFRSLLRDYFAKFAGKAVRIDDFQSLARERAGQARTASATPVAAPDAADGASPNLAAFFAQWLHSTGVPEFKLEYVIYRTQKGFKIVGKVRQDLETFRQTINVRVDTEGNPETKQIDVIGSNSDFTIETFGRPRPGGIILDPENHLLKSSPRLRVRASIARGEAFAEEGRYYEAIQQYQTALETQPNSSLAHFRMAEAFFYQKNRQAAANAFRDAIDGDRDPKWIEVWSHIYLGKIFDVTGQRERAVNEYQRAVETSDDTGGAQAEAQKYLKTPYTEPN